LSPSLSLPFSSLYIPPSPHSLSTSFYLSLPLLPLSLSPSPRSLPLSLSLFLFPFMPSDFLTTSISPCSISFSSISPCFLQLRSLHLFLPLTPSLVLMTTIYAITANSIDCHVRRRRLGLASWPSHLLGKLTSPSSLSPSLSLSL